MIEYLAGLRPFLSRVAPTKFPSANTRSAGPSQASCRLAEYS